MSFRVTQRLLEYLACGMAPWPQFKQWKHHLWFAFR